MAIGTALLAGGAILNAIGQHREGAAADKAGKHNAKLREMAGGADAAQIRREGAASQGRIRSAIGKSGVAFEGTPINVLAEDAMNTELDVLNTLWSAQTGAELSRHRGHVARRAGNLGAGVSLLKAGTGFL